MKNLIKKFIALSLVGILLGFSLCTASVAGMASTAFAEGEGEEDINNTDALKNLTFPVSDILTTKTACKDNADCGGNQSCIASESNPDKKFCAEDGQVQSYFSGSEFSIVLFLLTIIDTMTKIAGTIAVLMLILTGFVMLFSQGNQNTIEKAKEMFMYTLLGLLAIFMSYIIITLIQGVFTT